VPLDGARGGISGTWIFLETVQRRAEGLGHRPAGKASLALLAELFRTAGAQSRQQIPMEGMLVKSDSISTNIDDPDGKSRPSPHGGVFLIHADLVGIVSFNMRSYARLF